MPNLTDATTEALRRIDFFDRHPEFGIAQPRPFTYGRRATVNAATGTIMWWDAREHGVDVTRVVENTADRLVVVDRLDRVFEFVPLTVAFWNERMPRYASPQTDEQVREMVRNDGYEP